MSNAFVQALLMDDPDTTSPVVDTCVPDPHYTCGPTNDPYFANVVLLLHGDGADGGTTITDSSSYARTPSLVSGCVTQTPEKKFGTAALDCTTGGGNIEYAASTDLSPLLEFTLEFWLRPGPTVAAPQFLFGVSGGIYFVIGTGSTTLSTNGWFSAGFGTSNLTNGVWKHFAMARDSTGTLRCFVDGVLAQTTVDGSVPGGSRPLGIFGVPGRPDLVSFTGQLDDIRFTQGVCRYTGSFTLPTSAYPDAVETIWSFADPRTVLLFHADSAPPTDLSCFQTKVMALAGSASISAAQSKFGTASLLSPNAGTATLNGMTVNEHQDFRFGTGPFTVEMWAYRNSNAFLTTLFAGSSRNAFSIEVNTSGVILLYVTSSGGAQTGVNTGVSFPLTTWVHFVAQRRGNDIELWLNGVLVYTLAITGGGTSTLNLGAFFFGRHDTNSFQAWNGYIDEVRVTRGVARYIATFAPQTTAFCASTTAPTRYDTSGTEKLTGQAITVSQGAVIVADPWKKLGGHAVNAFAGTLGILDPNKTAPLVGQRVTAATGTTYRPRFPELVSTSAWPYIASAAGPTTTAYVQIEFRADTSFWVGTNTASLALYGFWLFNPYSFYANADIVYLYKISSVALIANGSFVSQTVAPTMASTSTFLIQNTPGAPNMYVEFEVTITPTDPSMVPFGPYATYVGTHRFRVNLNSI